MNFLAVDDSSTMRKIVSLALKGAGHEVQEAEHGKDALEKLKVGSYDCIILDINMPEMNGIEFLKARGALPAAAKVPVIVLTTQDEAPLRDESMKLGASAFLAKPFQKEELLAAVKTVLRV
ncbi:MAG: response regulator [Spirochaetaceae bacterium]|nr:response regulator [Spirochaetaceae bacterium]